jgi:hypothetical protein
VALAPPGGRQEALQVLAGCDQRFLDVRIVKPSLRQPAQTMPGLRLGKSGSTQIFRLRIALL